MVLRLVSATVSAWEVEDIPDEDTLYMRVLGREIKDDDIPEFAFSDRRGEGKSVDWCKYARPEFTRHGNQGADKYAVIAFRKGDICSFEELSVQHDPEPPVPESEDLKERVGNRAHANIHGLNIPEARRKTKIRADLRRMAQLVIRAEDPVMPFEDIIGP